MSAQIDKLHADPTVHRNNGWAVGLRSLAIILLLMASWIAAFDHSLWR